MALSANSPVIQEQGNRSEYPVTTGGVIYEGSAVGLISGTGYVRALVAGDVFLGFAETKADNTGGASGAINVRVIDEGKFSLSVGSLAITDVGKPVYASDDGTFTLTASTNSYVGRVIRYSSSGVGVVSYCVGEKPGILAALVDNSGGAAANGTIEVLVDAGGTAAGAPTTASVAAAITELATKLNAVLKILE